MLLADCGVALSATARDWFVSRSWLEEVCTTDVYAEQVATGGLPASEPHGRLSVKGHSTLSGSKSVRVSVHQEAYDIFAVDVTARMYKLYICTGRTMDNMR